MTGAWIFVSGMSPHGVDSEEMLQYVAGWVYVVVAVVYTLLVFWSDALDSLSSLLRSPHLTSGQRPIRRYRITKKPGQLFFTHTLYTAILLCCLRSIGILLPYLPQILTFTFSVGKRSRASLVDFVFLLLASVLAWNEKRQLCSPVVMV